MENCFIPVPESAPTNGGTVSPEVLAVGHLLAIRALILWPHCH
jgi:hypothetical protein